METITLALFPLILSIFLLLLICIPPAFDQPARSSPFRSLAGNNRNYIKESFPSPTKVKKMKSSRDLARLEGDLARARAAIRIAIRTRNYTSKVNSMEEYIPRGPVYWNPHSFHQSHAEMIKRFRIWVYKEGERPLMHIGPMKDIYSIEGQFMAEMERGDSIFLAKHPDQAHAFFLPISVVNIVEYLYKPITSYDRTRLVRIFKEYVEFIAKKHPYWKRSHGSDHFMVSCHDWGPDISLYEKKMFRNLIRVLCNANTSEGFNPTRDVPMPELNTPSSKVRQASAGLPPEDRKILAFFAGGAHGDIRKILLKQWKEKDKEVRVHEYLSPGENYSRLMEESKFCLCPSGYEVASPRLVESISSGCVPVVISDHYSLPLSDILDWRQLGVHIPPEKIPEIKEILRKVDYLKLQRNVIQVQRHFQLNRPAKPYDVIHMLLHSIWLRRLNIKLPT